MAPAEKPTPSVPAPSIEATPVVTEEEESAPPEEEEKEAAPEEVGKVAPPAVEPTPSSAIEFAALTEKENIIKVKAQGIVIHYQRQSFWGEDELSTILQHKDDFSCDVIAKFVDDLAKYGKSAINAAVEFSEDTKSTILRCDVHGAISKRDNSYYAVFSWLLKPLRLDFIDNDFEESEKGLFWEGFTNGVPTTVTVELPTIDGLVYEAWAHPVGHCHAHAWWELPQ